MDSHTGLTTIYEACQQVLEGTLTLQDLANWIAVNQWEMLPSEKNFTERIEAILFWWQDEHLDDAGVRWTILALLLGIIT